jgi:adenylate cyclase
VDDLPPSTAHVARQVGSTPATLGRWIDRGLIPQYEGTWTPAAVVHEPLMREGVPGVEIAEEMQGLAAELLPLASPMMDQVHQRLLAHFVDQDVVRHMESDLDPRERLDLGHLRVAIAFADLKTIGDEVMVVSADPGALVDWAVGFQALHATRPLPRIGMHYGEVLYRDGDHYGREVIQAARVATRAGWGEVLVTRPVVAAAGPHLEFELIGEVRLKGFTGPTELFEARAAEGWVVCAAFGGGCVVRGVAAWRAGSNCITE